MQFIELLRALLLKSLLEVKGDSDLQAKFYVSASGQVVRAAGDYLKDHLNSKIAVVEATECPLYLIMDTENIIFKV